MARNRPCTSATARSPPGSTSCRWTSPTTARRSPRSTGASGSPTAATVERIGSTIPLRVTAHSVSGPVGRPRDWVVTDEAGSLLAWLEYPGRASGPSGAGGLRLEQSRRAGPGSDRRARPQLRDDPRPRGSGGLPGRGLERLPGPGLAASVRRGRRRVRTRRPGRRRGRPSRGQSGPGRRTLGRRRQAPALGRQRPRPHLGRVAHGARLPARRAHRPAAPASRSRSGSPTGTKTASCGSCSGWTTTGSP